MAITTVDQIIAGMLPPISMQKASFTGEAAGLWHALAALAGNPGPIALGTPGLNGASVSANALGGAFAFVNPATGNSYLARMSFMAGANLVGFKLYDLLWYNTGIAVTTTTAQNITFSGLPSRCVPASGSTPDANGGNIEAWLWSTTATTNAGAIANTTYSYTNEGGTSGRSGGLAYSWPATAVAGTMVPFQLQAGDRGVRSIASITLGTSYGGGAISLICLRSISEIYLPVASSGICLDWAGLGFPQLFDSSALYGAVMLSGTAAGSTAGALSIAQG
jgi:hypothetical protein